MNSNDIGAYGVLRFVRRDDDTVVASFPIDKQEISLGRTQACDIRMYYPKVSDIHARIFFQERKAFIMVLGIHGVLIDNCLVFPESSSAPTTVPLSNNSEVEIHNKRFRFEYPPKDMRAALIATPSPVKGKGNGSRRALRLSMIQSAQVFSPKPDPDPRVNLRVLQTPIRSLGSPLKPGSRARLQREVDGDEDEEADEEPIVLVEGDRPRVVEEDKDLVILEDVVVRPQPVATQPPDMQSRRPSTSASLAFAGRSRQASGSYAPAPPLVRPQPQYQTPRRKPPQSSLHRAVLIRSAQRAVMREESEKREEERDVQDVETAILDEREVIEEEPPQQEYEIELQEEDGNDDYEEELNNEGEEEEEDRLGRGRERTQPVSGWRKSLEAVKNTWQAIRSRSTSPEKVERHERAGSIAVDDGDEPGYQDEEMENNENAQTVPVDAEPESEHDAYATEPSSQQFMPQRPPRALQGLMSPQRPQRTLQAFMTPQPARTHERLADRVRGVGRFSVGGSAFRTMGSPWKEGNSQAELPINNAGRGGAFQRRRVSKEEQEAIQERRRSAFAAPDAFFGNEVPGSRRTSLAPAAFASPAKMVRGQVEEEEEDTGALLERMKEMVDVMKRRRSIVEDQNSRPVVNETVEEEEEDAVDLFAEGVEDDVIDNAKDEMDVDEPADEAIAEGNAVAGPSTAPQALEQQPNTPHMSDLRHLFPAVEPAATPRFAGVREMFNEAARGDHEIPTPRMDGLQDLFHQEVDTSVQIPDADQVGVDTSEDEQIPDVAPLAKAKKTPKAEPKPTSKSKIPAPATARTRRAPTRGRVTPTDVSGMADDEQTPDVPTPGPSKKVAVDVPKAAVVRRTRRANSQVEDESPAVVPKPSSRTKKTETATTSRASAKAKAVIPKIEEDAPVLGPVRRTRKAAKSAPSTDDEPAPVKSVGKPTKAAKAAAVSDSEPQQPEPPKAMRRVATRTKVSDAETSAPKRRGTRAKTSDVETTSNGDDPLDSIDRADSPEAAPVAAKVRRGRSQATVAPDDEEDVAPRTTRGGRKTPTTRSRSVVSKSRTAASSSKLVQSKEKENTPEPKAVKEEEEEAAPLKPATAKVARTRKMAAAAQSEPEKETAPKTRIARTRAASARK